MAAHWRISVTGGSSKDLPDSFTLQSYNRSTEFIENVLDGQDGVIIDSESRREGAFNFILIGIIKKDNPTDEDTELIAIENILDSREDDLNLVNIDTSTSYPVQHVNTTARRSPAGILNVTIVLRGNITIL